MKQVEPTTRLELKHKKMRQSNFEMLRIISMFLIVLGHFAWQSDFTYYNNFSANNIYIHALWMGGKLGVNLFVLISAYFLSKSRFKKASLLKLWKLTLFYSVGIYMILLVTKQIHFSLWDAFRSVFPIITGSYWFVTAYVVMYLLFPYINLALNQLSRKQLQSVILIAVFLFMVCTTLFKNTAIGNTGDDGITISVVYIVGYYLRRFSEEFGKSHLKYYWMLFLGSVVLMVLSVYMITFVRIHSNHFQQPTSYAMFLSGTSPLQLTAAVGLFLIVKNTKVGYSAVINYVASSMFAVYLIHCQSSFVNVLWLKIIRANRFQHSAKLLLIAVGISVLLFVVCTIIDVLRRLIFKLLKLNF